MRGPMAALTIAVILGVPVAAQAQDWYTNGWLYAERMPVTIRNPASDQRPDEPVVLQVADLQERAEDFNPLCFVVVDPAAEPDQEKELGGNDVPSQADDMDGDGQVDEIIFEVGLKSRESKQVFVYYQPGETAVPLDYVRRADARFSQRYEGPGWESNLIAYRLYFDARNAIDVFGKTRPGLSLETFADPEHDYHELSEAGVDVLHIGDALGVGGFAFSREGGLMRPEVCTRAARIVARGPVRAVVEARYLHWPVGTGGREADVTSHFTIWANHRWSEHRLVVEGLKDFRPATGVPQVGGDAVASPVRTLRGKGYLGTWGRQSDAGDYLGLGIVYDTRDLAASAEDDLNHLVLFKGVGERPIAWWLLAAWEKETDAITRLPDFVSLLQRLQERLTTPVDVTIGLPEQPSGT